MQRGNAGTNKSTNHMTTDVSLAELFFKRKLTTKPLEFVEAGGQSDVLLQQVRDHNAAKKQ